MLLHAPASSDELDVGLRAGSPRPRPLFVGPSNRDWPVDTGRPGRP